MAKFLKILSIIALVLVVVVSSIELVAYLKGGCKCKGETTPQTPVNDANAPVIENTSVNLPVVGAIEHDETINEA